MILKTALISISIIYSLGVVAFATIAYGSHDRNWTSRHSAIGKQPYLDWSKVVDKVYLITTSQERLEKVENILAGLGLKKYTKVMTFDVDKEDRARGCYNSHLAVMRSELELQQESGTSANRVLILEDNMEVNPLLKGYFQAIVNSVAVFINERDSSSWGIFHLTYNPYIPNLKLKPTKGFTNAVQLFSGKYTAIGTTAYIINAHGLEQMIKHDQEHGGYVDGPVLPITMGEVFPESRYAAFPTPFLRSPSTKSIVSPQLNDIRSILFQPLCIGFFQGVLLATGLTTNMLLVWVTVFLLIGSFFATRHALRSMYVILTKGLGHLNGCSILFSVVTMALSFAFLFIIVMGFVLRLQRSSKA